ncbi:hypothetical protein NC653_004993 [Populus alba x Populus x berolinensis]|uniref:Uncharacterized protein n=1 Tax=Populus alba x Populus x berolinensis TaxID=444605 RepID=A0AAD6WAJ0_9ROSI|nr:hypothetical protein NC653_004993 [Populus alba x Populus x berolinensis]
MGIAIIVGGVTPRCPTAHKIRQDSYCTRTVLSIIPAKHKHLLISLPRPLPPVNSAFNNTQNKTPLVFCERKNRSFLGEKRREKTTQQPVPAIDVKESTVDPFLVEALQNHIFLTPLIHSEGFCCRQARVQPDKLLLKPVSSLTIEESVLLPRFLVASEAYFATLFPFMLPRALAGRRLCCYKDHWCILEGYVATTLCWIVLWSGVGICIFLLSSVFLDGCFPFACLCLVLGLFLLRYKQRNSFSQWKRHLQSILECSSLVPGSVISEPALN